MFKLLGDPLVKRLKKKQLAKKQKTKSQLPADDEGSESSSTSEGSQDE